MCLIVASVIIDSQRPYTEISQLPPIKSSALRDQSFAQDNNIYQSREIYLIFWVFIVYIFGTAKLV